MSAQPAGEQSATARLVSLDAFRGLTILGMLLVNNVALDTATPRNLTHAPWNQGVNFADMVFPWFLFIVGVAIPYAVASARRKGISTRRQYLKALGRCVTLVLIGCLIDSSIVKRPVFDLGVLQLIGLAYFFAAVLYAASAPIRLVVATALLLSHWALLRFVSVPGAGAGVFSESQNVVRYINDVYLRSYHLQGLVSVIPTSALVIIGSTLGDLLRSAKHPPIRKSFFLVAAGVAMGLVGWIWNLDLPFNKPVWTPSYILFTAGWASFLLGALHLTIDVKGWRKWAFPLVIFGMNAIVAYVLPILVKVFILREWLWQMPDGSMLPIQQAYLYYLVVHTSKIAGGWIYTISYMLFWWLVILEFYRRKLFIRI
jgi:predicted acyltransferase